MISFLTCPECGNMTFVGADRRVDTIYCSGKCRSRAYRRYDAFTSRSRPVRSAGIRTLRR